MRAAVHDATGSRLTFAPDPSSQSRACLGGAIGNDACGNHSVRYGRTADHVVALRGGRLAMQGTPADLMRPETLAAIYGLPMQVMPHPSGSHRIAVAH